MIVDMVKRKTVCVVMGGHFSATIGGAQYQAQCVVEGLKRTGLYNIYYLTREFDPNFDPKGYEIIKIADSNGIRKYGFIFDTRRLLSLLSEIKPDAIYQRGLKSYTGVVARYARQSNSQSIFHIAHDYNLMPLHMKGWSRLYWLRWIEKRIGEYGLRHVDKVIAQTQYQADLLYKNYGVKAAAVIPNFHPLPEEKIEKCATSINILWVANFKTVKRPELFVRLARELAYREELSFTMIGRCGELDKYRFLHREIESLTNLTYMGEQPIEEVNRQLASAHIFVNTSRAEGFPNTFIQAWMRKVPTVSLGVDPDGVLERDKLGYCANSYDELRSNVLALCDNSSLREAMGERAQQHAYQVHSPNGVDKLIDLMKCTS